MRETRQRTGAGEPRRDFLKRGSFLAAGAMAAPMVGMTSRAKAADSRTLKVGLVGCGGRGTGAANQALVADPNTVLHAMGDVFEDRIKGSVEQLRTAHPERMQVTPDTTFVGFDAIDKVLGSGVDVVLLATPPGFRPQHIRKAVEAGKHVFAEKPMAVDGPGVRSLLESAAMAKQKRLSLVSGFCYRYNDGVRALMQQVQDGVIGELMALYNTFNTGYLWVNPRRPEWNDMTYQLRNWYYYAWLSGDHLVEQGVHSLDKMAWAMGDVPPVKCVAHGGRQVRTGEEFGHIFDHFSVVYEYASGARGFHFSRQQSNTAADNSDYFMGTKGVAHIVRAFGGPYLVRDSKGATVWRYRSERTRDMYQVEHDEMFDGIRRGEPINDGVWMAHSTLLAIMGRMAAYTGQEITWEQALNSREDLGKWVTFQEEAEGHPTLTWDQPLRVPPVAMPGQTAFL